MFCFDTLTFYSLYSKMTIVCLFLGIWNIKDSMWWWLALVFWRQNFTNHVLGITQALLPVQNYLLLQKLFNEKLEFNIDMVI